MDARVVINCSNCGAPLIEDLDAATLTVDGEEIPFKRATDYVVCGTCGSAWSVRSLRAEAVARGDLAVDPDDDLSGPVQDEADAVVAAIRALAGRAGEVDDTDIVLTALSDIDRESQDE